MLPRWLNVREAALYCGLSETTLKRVIVAGKIRSFMAGRRLIDRWSLDAWIEGDSEPSKRPSQGELPRMNELDVQAIARAVSGLLTPSADQLPATDIVP